MIILDSDSVLHSVRPFRVSSFWKQAVYEVHHSNLFLMTCHDSGMCRVILLNEACHICFWGMKRVIRTCFIYECVKWQFLLKKLHLRNQPNRKTQIPQYLAVQIQIEMLVSFEFIPRNFSFSIWWISQA